MTAPRRSTWSAAAGGGLGVNLDVTEPARRAAMVEAALQAFGRLDALINNAALYGALHGGRFDAIDEAEWDAAMAVNVKGIWNCCKAAVPAMRQAGGGSIVNIASLAATYGMPYGLHYTTSKAAVIGLTRGLARELGRDRIRVNALAPSAVITEGTREFFGDKLDRALETIKSRPDDPAQSDAGGPRRRRDVAGLGRQRLCHRPDHRGRWRHGDAVRGSRPMELTGKAALISGAGGGICRAIALAFAEAGAAVACGDIDPAAAERPPDWSPRPAARAVAGCDVADEAETLAVAEAAQRAFGRLDILVSGAAPHDPSGTVIETSLADWQRVLDINLTGSFLLSRAVLPLMIAGGGGSIIFIASQLGRVGSAGRAAYCATKGALIQLAKVMAIDHAAQNIRVNTLSPGGVETQRTLNRYG